MIDVECRVRGDYDGERNDALALVVRNHGIYNDRVRIEVDGVIYCVLARDLIAAVENATRSAR